MSLSLLYFIFIYRTNLSTPYTWRLWNEGAPLKLVDFAIDTNFSTNEVERCIQVGLMCVQEDPAKRPSIDSILLMLHTQPTPVSSPVTTPAFLYKRDTREISLETSQYLVSGTISDLCPR
ncbi:hypothetical protein RND81_06G127200 [Saponaria officinalis]|uniref:Uncharacterized protein n=1 Tax=Saponaria officinalis TaxID=3572 RepID=A0AAW1K981_SAPOF